MSQAAPIATWTMGAVQGLSNVNLPVVQIPVNKVSCTLASYGCAGSAELTTSLAKTNEILSKGLTFGTLQGGLSFGDIITAAQSGNIECKLAIDGNQIFVGLLDLTEMHIENDHLVIPCRDYTSLLMEDTSIARVTLNKTIAQFVQGIIAPFGLTKSVVGVQSGYANQPIGSYFKSDRSLLYRTETAWQILSKLAMVNGFTMFVDRNKVFYMDFPVPPVEGPLAPIGVPQNTPGLVRTYTWGSKEVIGNIVTCHVSHSGRRNSTFVVNVTSYTPRDGKQVVSSGAFVSQAMGQVLGISPGLYQNGVPPKVASGNFPVYNYALGNLEAADAARECRSRIVDLASHEFILHCKILGDATLDLYSYVRVRNTGFPRLDGQLFRVVGVEHEYDVIGGGFLTSFTAWKVPL